MTNRIMYIDRSLLVGVDYDQQVHLYRYKFVGLLTSRLKHIDRSLFVCVEYDQLVHVY